MTREQAKATLVTLGIAEPTDEQISAYLNTVNGAVKQEKDKAERYKAEADKVAELQAKLDEINNQGLSEVEKANKATEAANLKIAELEKSLEMMRVQNNLAALGITGEDAQNFFDENGKVNFTLLGQIMTTREENAAKKREAELAGKAGNPGGSGGGENEKTEGMSFAEKFNSIHAQEGGKNL